MFNIINTNMISTLNEIMYSSEDMCKMNKWLVEYSITIISCKPSWLCKQVMHLQCAVRVYRPSVCFYMNVHKIK